MSVLYHKIAIRPHLRHTNAEHSTNVVDDGATLVHEQDNDDVE